MKRLALASLLVLLFAASAAAQTVTRTLQYEFATTPLAEVNTYVTTLKIDAAAATQISPTCVAGTTPATSCSTPITLTSGTHTIVVTVFNTSGVSASGTLNYDPGSNPGTPINIKIVIKITVP